MKPIFILLLLTAVSFSMPFDLLTQYTNFKSYAQNYNKQYSSYAEQFFRFGVYLKNIAAIQKLNLQEQGTAIYGETRFTDLTISQAKQHMGLKIPKDFKYKYIANYTNETKYTPKQDTPDIWNWEQQGAVTSVKDQGTCGSCWTFSVAGNVEGMFWMKNKELVEFSMQQLIDCDKSNFGCSGGWPYNAIDWLAKNGGMETLSQYPLRANYSGPCLFNASKAYTQVKGYLNISHDETIIKDALYQKGPLSILLDFTGLMHYKSGVANPRWCSTWPDHALLLVGYGTKDEDYWLIKNSWGPKWGVNGYLMLKRGHKKCGVDLWATTAVL